MYGGGGGFVAKLCPTLSTPWTVACQAPLPMGFSRQEYWSGLPFPSPIYMYKNVYMYKKNVYIWKRISACNARDAC